MKPPKRIVVTGLGAVSTWGWSVGELREALREGRSGVGVPRRFSTEGHRTAVVAEAPPEPEGTRDFPGWGRMSRADRFAVVAARRAVEQAGLEPHDAPWAIFFGGSTAGMDEGEAFFRALVGRDAGHPRIVWLSSHQLNGPGDAVARHLGTRGPVETVSSACASGGLALGTALEALRAGEVDVAIAGGADSLCDLTYAGFNSLRAVDPNPCRPFRASREGLSIGEGAGVVVLETEGHARRRGAEILAELAGAGASCDAYHMTAPHPEGEGAERAIRAALADAGLAPDDVDFLNAHGTGTPLNDRAESAAVRRVFGERPLPVTSTKGSVGHLLGSSGAVEAVATVLSIVDGAVHPTPFDDEPPDPDLGVDLVLGRPRVLAHSRTGVSTSFAFGGSNAAVVFRRFGA